MPNYFSFCWEPPLEVETLSLKYLATELPNVKKMDATSLILRAVLSSKNNFEIGVNNNTVNKSLLCTSPVHNLKFRLFSSDASSLKVLKKYQLTIPERSNPMPDQWPTFLTIEL